MDPSSRSMTCLNAVWWLTWTTTRTTSNWIAAAARTKAISSTSCACKDDGWGEISAGWSDRRRWMRRKKNGSTLYSYTSLRQVRDEGALTQPDADPPCTTQISMLSSIMAEMGSSGWQQPPFNQNALLTHPVRDAVYWVGKIWLLELFFQKSRPRQRC